MKSPITGKEMALRKEERRMIFRKEEFTVVYHFYLCEETSEKFTSTELDELNINQLYNEYRHKYNLPFPDEIEAIRKKYGLSAVKMSEALGFGVNIYRNYETGEVPNESNGKLIKLANDPKIFKQIVEQSTVLEQKIREKVFEKIDEVCEKEKLHHFISELEGYFLGSQLPDEFSGYRKPNFEKFIEMIVFFAEKLQPWKTKLNKLLFYADFVYFRQTCFSMSGARYRAIDLGPVPKNYDAIFEFIANRDDVDICRTEFPNGSMGEQFKPNPKKRFNSELFTEHELKTMHYIADTFSNISTAEIVEISHREKAWKENEKGKQLISYKYGFDLEAI